MALFHATAMVLLLNQPEKRYTFNPVLIPDVLVDTTTERFKQDPESAKNFFKVRWNTMAAWRRSLLQTGTLANNT